MANFLTISVAFVALFAVLYAVSDVFLWLVKRDRGLKMAIREPCALCGNERPQWWRFFLWKRCEGCTHQYCRVCATTLDDDGNWLRGRRARCDLCDGAVK